VSASTQTASSTPNRIEFIALMAMLMSMTALTVDAMLPALMQIGQSLNVEDANHNQLIVATVFLGMALGQMLYGPISDAYGRKPAIYLGGVIFLVGAGFSIFAQDFNTMLLGRILQGMGAASCRVVTLAMIRDCFDGKEMARTMSLIMLVFIMVPAIAPSIGQGILLVGHWRAIFVFLFVFALVALLWLAFRQTETLSPKNKIPLSWQNTFNGIKETITHPLSRNYMIAAGVMFGAFVGYLSSAQQILQIQYELGSLFSLYFGVLALAIGFSSFINSKLVMHIAIEKLCIIALMATSLFSIVFFSIQYFSASPLPLSWFMFYLLIMFFMFGILFGNVNTLAVHPLGHIAGVANSVISTVQTLLSVLIGSFIGQSYDGTTLPLILGFLLCGSASLVLMIYTVRKKHRLEM